jgi:hypothetical protein
MPTIHTLGLQAELVATRRMLEPRSGQTLEASDSAVDALMHHWDHVNFVDAIIHFEPAAVQLLDYVIILL